MEQDLGLWVIVYGKEIGNVVLQKFPRYYCPQKSRSQRSEIQTEKNMKKIF